MKKTSRRNLFKAAGLGGVAAGLAVAGRTPIPGLGEALRAEPQGGGAPTGPLSQASVTFGAWMPTGLDRYSAPATPGDNHHTVVPNEVTIRAGGSVSFIISGFHQIQIFDDGTLPEQIDSSMLTGTPPPGFPFPGFFIDDDNNRIYRGPDPVGLPEDRVESVVFPDPGTYLVICGVIVHFLDEMWGFVRVLP